jgi:hypothetical protein
MHLYIFYLNNGYLIIIILSKLEEDKARVTQAKIDSTASEAALAPRRLELQKELELIEAKKMVFHLKLLTVIDLPESLSTRFVIS